MWQCRYTVVISSVDLDDDSGSLLYANFFSSCIFCNSLHMYTNQMDTCMGMGFIDAEESRVPKVTSIDPTSGPRAGGSQIVVAGSGGTRVAPMPLRAAPIPRL